MASRSKRFRSCTVRIASVSTSGIKRARTINLKASKSSNKSEKADVYKETSLHGQDHNVADMGDSDPEVIPTNSPNQPSDFSQHQCRRLKEYARWEDVRETLLNCRIEEAAFFPGDIECCDCESDAEIRCVDCGHDVYFCETCARKNHNGRNHFHVLEYFKDGCFLPLFPNHSIMALSHQRNCHSSTQRTVVYIDQYGQQHQKQILFCDSEDDTATLLKMHLWPSTVKRPVLAFHLKLMKLLEALVLECHTSLQKFCHMLNVINRSSLLPKWVKNIYSGLNGDSFDEFRFQQYLLRSRRPHFSEPVHHEDLECPLCPKDNQDDGESIIECMDGCFGLVRKKSASTNICPSRHGLNMFADQDDVDNFVENYTNAKSAIVECNEFKAGEITTMLRSKGKNKLYDEKGVFGRVCRHDYPKGFINMKHGERIAYSIYEIQRMLDKYANTNVGVKISYDIACTLEAHLKKNDRDDILDRVILAIPVFHCYGHKSSCQIQFSPRRLAGFALTDGENIERLWSCLRGFSSMTKEMSSGRRTDMLTDALLHYCSRQLHSFGSQLLAKLKKCPSLIENTSIQLQELFSNLQVVYDKSVVSTWMKDEENLILVKGRKKIPLTWEHNYVQNLIHLHQLRLNVASVEEGDNNQLVEVVKKTKQVIKSLKSTERSQNISRRWKPGENRFNTKALSLENQRRECILEQTFNLAVERMFLISLKRKYSDVQAVATKLSRQINLKTNAIKSTVTKYNASLTALQDYINGLPDELQFDEVKDPESVLYSNFREDDTRKDVPLSVKRSAIDLQCFLERCKEEQLFLLKEVERLFIYYLEKIENYETFLEQHCQEQTKLINGLCSIAKKQICEAQNTVESLRCMLSDYISPRIVDKLSRVKITTCCHMSDKLETIEENIDAEYFSEEDNEDLVELLDFDDEEEQ